MQPVLQIIDARRAVRRQRAHHRRERHRQEPGGAGAARGVAARARPMVTINAGGVSEGVFESELFGHVKGAFTDAKQDRVGRFELADGSTLFLDEIANVPLGQQQKLLRVLETGEFERLGSSRTRKADVRLISATNADLNAEVAAGRFRQDLLFRLNTIEVHLPPLRERRDDIPRLARALPGGARAALSQADHRLRSGRAAGAGRPRLAGQRARAGPRRRARHADGAGQRHPRRRPGPAPGATRRSERLDEMSLEDVEAC